MLYQIFLLLILDLVVWGEVLKELDLMKVVEYVKKPSNKYNHTTEVGLCFRLVVEETYVNFFYSSHLLIWLVIM